MPESVLIREELENPYLDKFYEELKICKGKPNKYSKPLQKYFLHKRFESESSLCPSHEYILTDRCLLEYYEIFIKNLRDSGLMTNEDFGDLSEIY